MKQIRPKNDEAVSPIIATILLIAITVVLAATLVTILGGFTHGVGNTVEIAGATVHEGPAVSGSKSSTTTLYLNVSSSSSNISSSQVTIIVTFNDGSTQTANLAGSSANITISGSSYFDAGSAYTITSLWTGNNIPSKTSEIKSIDLTYKGNSIYTSGLITIS